MSVKKREKRKSGTLTEMQRGERERERGRERENEREAKTEYNKTRVDRFFQTVQNTSQVEIFL